MNKEIKPKCTGCNKYADEIAEYIECGKEEEMPPSEYVIQNEGTYNPSNGHFLCTECYIDAGMPSSPYPNRSWIAP